MVTEARPLALVTGGARRVGRAIALTLARAGCDLIVTYRGGEAEARSLVTEAAQAGAQIAIERLDLGHLDQVRTFARAIARAHPRLDVVVHNASAYVPTTLDDLRGSPSAAHDPAAIMLVNAVSPLVLTAGLVEPMRRSLLPGGAGVVAMCDIHAMGRPRRDHAAYAMSKSALAGMVESLAIDLAPSIRVNGVAPGVVLWPDSGPEADAAMQDRYLKRVPLGRAGTPWDAAEAVRWLALDAHYTTGQILAVDGGRFLG